MVPLHEERDVETLRQISVLLERENQRLLAANIELRAELARLRGEPEIEQLTFSVASSAPVARSAPPPSPRPRVPRPGHGPRAQPALPIVETVHTRFADHRACPTCGGTLVEMTGQYETAEGITTVKLSDHVERHARQKYRCACSGAVVTAPGPAALIPGGRYAPAFAVGVAVAKYTDHLPLERQVRMMAREGLVVDSQTLWDQINALARHLHPTYEALGQRALAAPVIAADETRWPRRHRINDGHGVGDPRADRRLLSHLARQVGRGGPPTAGRVPRRRRPRWLRRVRGPRTGGARPHPGPLLGAHTAQIPRDRRPVAHRVRGDLHPHRGALRGRAPRVRPLSRGRRCPSRTPAPPAGAVSADP